MVAECDSCSAIGVHNSPTHRDRPADGQRRLPQSGARRSGARGCEPMTGLADRLERELYAARTARPRDSARYAAVLERAVRMCGADSEATEAIDLAELYLELATEYQALGGW